MSEQRSFPSLPGDWKTPPAAPSRLGFSPGLRLTVVFLLLAVMPAAVGLRLVYLQVTLAGDYRDRFARPRLRVQSIPTTRGRILAGGSSGLVLARDEPVLTLSVHYRWLEEPPDATWLAHQARSRLPSRKRRNRGLVDAEKRRLLAERNELWTNLSLLTGRTEAELRESAQAVQQRVEEIWRLVNRNHRAPDRQRRGIAPAPPPASAPWWQRARHALVDALTAPPEPEDPEALTIVEQQTFHPVVEDVTRKMVAEVQAHPQRYPGVRVVVQSRRVYPEGPVACHVLGYLGKVSERELNQQQEGAGESNADPTPEYQPDDRVGRLGVEASYETVLRGHRGRRLQRVDRRGNVLSVEQTVEPRSGRDIQLTLDLALQRETERLLEEAIASRDGDGTNGEQQPSAASSHGGAAVVLDVQTGAVLAAASAPRFDPNPLSNSDPAAWRRVSGHPAHPLFNRFAAGALPPGSVFKTLSAIAALESGLIDPRETFYCQGYLRHPDRLRCLIFTKYNVGHGPTRMVDALQRSCNVYFYHAAEQIGPRRLCRWAERLGFGRPTGIDLPSESDGNLTTPDNVRQREGHGWRRGDTPRLAIGQASLTATPLQVARLLAAVANGGRLVKPHVVAGFGAGFISQENEDDGEADRRLHSEVAPAGRIPDLSAATLRVVREGLRRVVEQGGTGHRTVYLESVAVAGKTGTADAGGGREAHAWFAGYAPAEQPRVAFAVVLEHAGSGGANAGPVARQMVETMVALGYFGAAK